MLDFQTQFWSKLAVEAFLDSFSWGDGVGWLVEKTTLATYSPFFTSTPSKSNRNRVIGNVSVLHCFSWGGWVVRWVKTWPSHYRFWIQASVLQPLKWSDCSNWQRKELNMTLARVYARLQSNNQEDLICSIPAPLPLHRGIQRYPEWGNRITHVT